MSDATDCHDYPSDERYATLRGRYLSKTTDLRLKEATAVAWSELGYSRRAIAREMEIGESTVKGYHEKAMALYGLELLEAHVPDAEQIDYDRIDADYVTQLSGRRKQAWLEAFDSHRGRLPQEWVSEVAPDR
ncbi:hypothetical protein GL213_03960 [Halogeometricum borinquense]|uniref:Uncharacterized protein n=1 Tax=Halogeometricum borinquense TaxID=60847 RepID=A0A6C0UJP0_9EURY|nr:hypothetical protein [Halogeometricum borinquense]QIB75754.1 hypothetical protein G3I44_16590 [Halogeometricum borinquense]QIQ75752.1 hypothetical protein GL213_03960 [Halogeometricum borinquense]